jgi:hypothetical protein
MWFVVNLIACYFDWVPYSPQEKLNEAVMVLNRSLQVGNID